MKKIGLWDGVLLRRALCPLHQRAYNSCRTLVTATSLISLFVSLKRTIWFLLFLFLSKAKQRTLTVFLGLLFFLVNGVETCEKKNTRAMFFNRF